MLKHGSWNQIKGSTIHGKTLQIAKANEFVLASSDGPYSITFKVVQKKKELLNWIVLITEYGIAKASISQIVQTVSTDKWYVFYAVLC